MNKVYLDNLIQQYSKTWKILGLYDENNLPVLTSPPISTLLTYEEAQIAIVELKKTLIETGDVSTLFGQEREPGQLAAILGNIQQTFDGVEVYPTLYEKAAHLMYFIIKDHPFTDGNKRIASFLFLLFLNRSGVSLDEISNNGLIAVALLVAESLPAQKDIMIGLITNFIN